eukprot:scaffold202423_cov30-Tisochrysis_lutea.AAC.3
MKSSTCFIGIAGPPPRSAVCSQPAPVPISTVVSKQGFGCASPTSTDPWGDEACEWERGCGLRRGRRAQGSDSCAPSPVTCQCSAIAPLTSGSFMMSQLARACSGDKMFRTIRMLDNEDIRGSTSENAQGCGVLKAAAVGVRIPARPPGL